LEAFDKNRLVYTMDGSLDFRHNVNKEFMNLTTISEMEADLNTTYRENSMNGDVDEPPPNLPRKKDGTLDMRYNACKDYVSNKKKEREQAQGK